MSNKFISTACVSLFALGMLNTANAALIDNGGFTTDSVSGLDWLDLSVTQSQSYNSAPTKNAGWRYATNLEVVGLFNTAFAGYTDTNTIKHYSDSNALGAYADQSIDATAFMDLFGVSGVASSFTASFGFYRDESNILRQMGVQQFATYSRVFSEENTNNWNGYENLGVQGNGVFLVRTSVVPVPAAVWLFGSGLIGLAGFARRKG